MDDFRRGANGRPVIAERCPSAVANVCGRHCYGGYCGMRAGQDREGRTLIVRCADCTANYLGIVTKTKGESK